MLTKSVAFTDRSLLILTQIGGAAYIRLSVGRFRPLTVEDCDALMEQIWAADDALVPLPPLSVISQGMGPEGTDVDPLEMGLAFVGIIVFGHLRTLLQDRVTPPAGNDDTKAELLESIIMIAGRVWATILSMDTAYRRVDGDQQAILCVEDIGAGRWTLPPTPVFFPVQPAEVTDTDLVYVPTDLDGIATPMLVVWETVPRWLVEAVATRKNSVNRNKSNADDEPLTLTDRSLLIIYDHDRTAIWLRHQFLKDDSASPVTREDILRLGDAGFDPDHQLQRERPQAAAALLIQLILMVARDDPEKQMALDNLVMWLSAKLWATCEESMATRGGSDTKEFVIHFVSANNGRLSVKVSHCREARIGGLVRKANLLARTAYLHGEMDSDGLLEPAIVVWDSIPEPFWDFL